MGGRAGWEARGCVERKVTLFTNPCYIHAVRVCVPRRTRRHTPPGLAPGPTRFRSRRTADRSTGRVMGHDGGGRDRVSRESIPWADKTCKIGRMH